MPLSEGRLPHNPSFRLPSGWLGNSTFRSERSGNSRFPMGEINPGKDDLCLDSDKNYAARQLSFYKSIRQLSFYPATHLTTQLTKQAPQLKSIHRTIQQLKSTQKTRPATQMVGTCLATHIYFLTYPATQIWIISGNSSRQLKSSRNSTDRLGNSSHLTVASLCIFASGSAAAISSICSTLIVLSSACPATVISCLSTMP